MDRQTLVSRRRMLLLAGIAAGVALSTGMAEATDEPVRHDEPREPCIGQPGYAERVARLFED